MADEATLEVLIQIREELAGLNRTKAAVKETKQEAESLGTILRQGLGIGTGMAIATGAVAMLKNTLMATVGEAFRLSGEIKDQSEALGVTAEAYQVLRYELAQAGVEASRLTMAVSTQTTSMAEARDSASSAAAAYRTLGLDLATIEAMPFEQRLENIARATLMAKDQTMGFQAAGVLLGSRGLPQLMNALRGLAKDGYGNVSAELVKMGQIMSGDTAARLDAAQKSIERFKQSVTIGVGETLAVGSRLGDAFKQDFWGTAWDFVKGAGSGVSVDLMARLGRLTPVDTGTKNTSTPDPLPLAQTVEWRKAEVALTAAQNREQIAAGSNTLSEAAHRRRLTAALEDQIYAQSQLLRLADVKTTPLAGSETEADRNKIIEQLRTQITLLHQRKAAAEEGPITRAKRAQWNFSNINNPDENADYMTAWQGLRVGAQEFLTGLGSMGQQTAAILQGSLGSALNSIGNDIWEAMKGTQEWGQMFTNLGDIAGRMLTQIITQMIVMKTLNMALGLFGFGITGNTGPTISKLPAVTAAGGGSFVTNGLTHFTVGDNPGGRERVTVEPLSGVGRSTINGQAIRMAGGGSAIVNGMGRSANGAASIIVNQTLNVATGVAQSVRAEFMAFMPAMRELAVDAVSEAVARGQLA